MLVLNRLTITVGNLFKCRVAFDCKRRFITNIPEHVVFNISDISNKMTGHYDSAVVMLNTT